MAGLLDFLQGASNAAASNISGPVDLLGMGLRGIGVPVPQNAFLSSQWMRERGLTREPQNRMAGLLGEAAGMSLPIVAAAKAPQIAQGLLQMGDNLAAPNPINTATRKQAGMFAGVSAKTADKAALAKAESLEKSGAAPEAIWKETGWFKSRDGNWRFEIDDSASEWLKKPKKATDEEFRSFLQANNAKKDFDALREAARQSPDFSIPKLFQDNPGLKDRVDWSRKVIGDYKNKYLNAQPQSGVAWDFLDHDPLYRAYPKIAEVRTTYDPAGSGGAYMPGLDHVTLGPGKERSTMLHELQHAIQQREGFGKGGGWADAANGNYRSLLGEVESRAVQSRMNMTPAQRASSFPLSSYDVPWDDLIVR
jgi:hypothetical protein